MKHSEPERPARMRVAAEHLRGWAASAEASAKASSSRDSAERSKMAPRETRSAKAPKRCSTAPHRTAPPRRSGSGGYNCTLQPTVYSFVTELLDVVDVVDSQRRDVRAQSAAPTVAVGPLANERGTGCGTGRYRSRELRGGQVRRYGNLGHRTHGYQSMPTVLYRHTKHTPKCACAGSATRHMLD